MITNAPQGDDLLKRACLKLETLEIPELPVSFWYDSEQVNIYNSALDDLQKAGDDVQEWRMSRSQLDGLDAAAFRSRVAAVLAYVRIPRTPQIGFHK
jgi:hypothetical protein